MVVVRSEVSIYARQGRVVEDRKFRKLAPARRNIYLWYLFWGSLKLRSYIIRLIFFSLFSRYAKVVYGYPKKRGGELMRCAQPLNDQSSYGPLYFLQRLIHSLDDTDVTTEGMDRKSFRSVELDDWFVTFWRYICLEKWIIPAASNKLHVAPIKSVILNLWFYLADSLFQQSNNRFCVFQTQQV